MEPILISLDRKHLAQRFGNNWELSKKDDTGIYRPFDRWAGNRRSLMRKLEEYGIVPSRQAEEVLLLVPEQPSFREDEPLSRKK